MSLFSCKLKGASLKLKATTNTELAAKLYALCLGLYAQKKFRCLYRRCPPLPIPNREVKPARADGTAVKCGRVGRCPILKLNPLAYAWGFLYSYTFFQLIPPIAGAFVSPTPQDRP